jgi:hypothetical protein
LNRVGVLKLLIRDNPALPINNQIPADMILNSFAVLDGSVAIIRLIAGLIVVWLGIASLRILRRMVTEERRILDDRYYLLTLVALLLLCLNVSSWPLLYLLLQSYVPEWPGVMCIYGVMQIGDGSDGSSRFLPTLVMTLQWLKPLLVFVTGVWFVLYIVNRQTQTGVLTTRVLLVLVVCGVITIADAGVELAYLTIPKKEEFLATGCCPAAFKDSIADQFPMNGSYPRILATAYFASCLGMAVALLQCSRVVQPSRLGLTLLWAAGALTFVVGRIFLNEIAAPSVLHLPYHHCPYDLIGGASETLAGIGMFAWGTLSVGWACLALWLGRSPETDGFLTAIVGRIAFMGFCCYLSAAVMAAVELSLA